MQLELHEHVGEDNNKRIWRFKGLVIKVKKKNHADGTFTIRGKAAGHTIEKVYPLSFPNFEKVLLTDLYKVRRSKLYYVRDKVGKDARMKSLLTNAEKGVDLLTLAKEELEEVKKLYEDALPKEEVTQQEEIQETQQEEQAEETQQEEQTEQQSQEEAQQE